MTNRRTVVILAVAAAALAATSAQAHGRHGRVWGGVSIGIGVPFHYGPYGEPWYAPVPVYAVPPPVVYAEPPEQSAPPAKAPPEPIFYPRNGQSASQLEADRQACNRWATTQPSAMADAGVFHRATQACMDAQGYTSR